MGQAPTPALSASCANATTHVVDPQINQENIWGLVFPNLIDRMYGKKAAIVSKIAMPLRNSFIMSKFYIRLDIKTTLTLWGKPPPLKNNK